jgi:hypothetical protein
MVGVKGLEPSTSRSQTAHSSQLSYTPTIVKPEHFAKQKEKLQENLFPFIMEA